MNNKGQTLISFIIVLPFLFLIFTYIFNKFYLTYEKRKLNIISEIACEYALNSKTDNEIERLILENDEKINSIYIKRDNTSITITLEKDTLSLLEEYKIKTETKCNE